MSNNNKGGEIAGALFRVAGAAAAGAIGAIGLHKGKEAKSRKKAMDKALRDNKKKRGN